jgi:16S rRNA (guanine966-N2)-methyltransferase
MPGRVRIIGGALRGRRLPVLDAASLRPTSDRVRETLFNWLTNDLPGGRVLDLFAGTGVLGLEALSRGAAHATFVESVPEIAHPLATAINSLGLTATAELHRGDARVFLKGRPQPYDVVFLDPPFGTDLLPPCCAALASGWLCPHAVVYVERAAGSAALPLPKGWTIRKQGRTQQVEFALFDTGAGSAVGSQKPRP